MLELLEGRPTERINLTLPAPLKDAVLASAKSRGIEVNQLIRHLLAEDIWNRSQAAAAKRLTRCSVCDTWYGPEQIAAHHHRLPQSGFLRDRWFASGLRWSEFHDLDAEAREWGHRDATS